jgi:diadenosine tetraphosphate (Ap4A) HIT family hydrolase
MRDFVGTVSHVHVHVHARPRPPTPVPRATFGLMGGTGRRERESEDCTVAANRRSPIPYRDSRGLSCWVVLCG